MGIIEKAKIFCEENMEMVRYFLPDKRFSVLFKVLNFISCDRLRHATVFGNIGVKDVEEAYNELVAFVTTPNGFSQEDESRILLGYLKYLGREIERAKKWCENIWEI